MRLDIFAPGNQPTGGYKFETSTPSLDVRFYVETLCSCCDPFSVKSGFAVKEADFRTKLSVGKGHIHLLWAEPREI